ncbi:sigma factor G inhibitor Gin [Bacillus sp. CLL-7-23]|uniref:Sigma factor G inhibitor Gin n=1 Tax=Bacillus changyiensis TaxID=3004103 RepID=A0ABT4X828_9BACI|nr:sigma factor G inhibitor Gin [Bacillus changyiensis]MDA7028408.1 sigma factor G inhibitor Gin [Bacillus changyiensis]
MKKRDSGEACIVCEEKKMKGIHLYTKFICEECEKKIISTSTTDPQYSEYVKKLKGIRTPPLYS